MMILDSVVDYNVWLSQVDANKLIEVPCRSFYCEPLFSKVKANVYTYIYKKKYIYACMYRMGRKKRNTNP